MKRWPRAWVWLLAGGIELIVLALAGVGAVTLVRRVNQMFARDTPPARVLEVPPGFEAAVYAEPGAARLPTVIAFGPEGDLYLLTLTGEIFVLEDADGDHRAEAARRIFANTPPVLSHAVGMAFHDGVLYVSDSGRISTLVDSDADGRLDKLTPIVEGLVSLRYPEHSNNGIAFGPDGKLYVGVGSTTDHGPLTDPMEAAILRLNPDGGDLEIFATGFRNPYDLAFSLDGDLFTADNNPSEFDRTLRSLEPEELNHVRPGRHYGFPDVFGNPPPGDASEPPFTEFYPSVGSAGLVYYAAAQFPPAYRDGVFVALYGTGAPVALDRQVTTGHMIVFVPLAPTGDGTYRGEWEVFARFNLDEIFLRPIDVTVGPDGALYIAEFQTATIYRVAYVGEAAGEAATPIAEPVPAFAPELVAAGEALYREGAPGAPPCLTCHLLDDRAGLGPSLRGLRDLAGRRVKGLGAEAYVRQSILSPDDYIVPGYNSGYMYQGYATSLTDEQVNALVAYVLSLPAPP